MKKKAGEPQKFCRAQVWDKLRWDFNQCSRKATKNGWCKQHHPDEDKARKKAAEERMKKLTDLRVRIALEEATTEQLENELRKRDEEFR